MADIGKTVKEIWEQSMKAVNKAATNIATSTKQKVDEMNIVTRRKELQNQLGLRLYELWQAGEDVPETLKATLEEMRDLEVKLQELRESKTTAPEDLSPPAWAITVCDTSKTAITISKVFERMKMAQAVLNIHL